MNSEALEISKNKGKEKNEGRDDAEDTSQQVPLLASKAGGGVDMVSLMQLWMEEGRRRDEENRRREEESRRKEDAWREEMHRQRQEAEKREERLLGKMQAQIEAVSRPVTCKPQAEQLNLPKLTAENSLDTFMSTFEAQLSLVVVPKSKWKLKLI